ncbi:DUF3313 family protein [Undibacterium jejuense]|uniref:DUF3313 family protein n=1 Tax=Undibacterium jejuense TaxID=1344949 RepID=A0A923HS41_9BURK|nr:DUF3313 family protein [Undibacterium jejuense]MBC3863708.1 DUF3313 family protein [Undibacterium jejuense]
MKKFLTFLLCLGLLSNLHAQDSQAVTSNGFLSEYSRLVLDPRSADNYFHYTPPEALGRKVGKIYFLKIKSYPEDKQFDLIDKSTADAMMEKLDQVLRHKLKDKNLLVDTPEQADTIVQIAATEAKTIDAGRDVIDFIPLRLLTKPIKDAAMGKQQQIVVTLEMSMRDAKTRQIVFEAVHHSAGKNIGRTGDTKLQANMKSLEPVVDAWTNKIVNEIADPK